MASEMIKRFSPILALTAACWIVFWVNALLWHGSLNRYGIIPRYTGSLPGILFSPFLHGSLDHLLANTVPLLVLGAILCARNPGEFVLVTLTGILFSGALTWVIGREAIHIGASGLIFCYFGYLVSLAVFERTLGAFLLSLFCLLAYGGILQGALPTSPNISWEGHIAGLLSGIAIAWMTPKSRRRARRDY